jgi:transcriptional regulator CtsR
MNLSNLIEEYINGIIGENDFIELKRSEVANHFKCVPSQINYVISTRFIPELGFYVESRRGGGGYIKISKSNLSKSECIAEIIDKIGSKMSQSVIDIYLRELMGYNVLEQKQAMLIKVAVSDNSLSKVDKSKRDEIRADIFKNLLINLI